MATVLFVHGTGVRRGSYLATLSILEKAFDHYDIAHTLEECLWGDALGAAPIRRSLPDRTLTPQKAELTPEQDYARWELLYRDSLFELRLLTNRPSDGPVSPAGLGALRGLLSRMDGYEPTEKVSADLASAGLEDYWSTAWTTIINAATTRTAVESAEEIGEPAQTVARAVVAEMLRLAFEAGSPVLDRRRRDEIVRQLVIDWKADVQGIGAFLLNFIADVVATAATPVLKWKRGPVAEGANPAAGDILRYQARGDALRTHIRRRIGEAANGDENEDVYLLAHSLGGIACVDMLAEKAEPRVKGLITAGSQAPYLHEIGALSKLDPGKPLPPHFPPWLNLYDPYDFLSYVAAPVFDHDPRVRDHRVESGQPFPQSHSAYWTNDDAWAEIRTFLT